MSEAEERRRRAKARRRQRREDEAPEDPSTEEGESEEDDDEAVPTGPTRQERLFVEGLQHHRRMAAGATLTIVGLALVGTRSTEAGSIVVLVGLLGLMYAIHRYGRLGTAEERARKA